MTEKRKIVKLGNSIGITFNKVIKLISGIDAGDEVSVLVQKDRIVIKKNG